MMITSKKSAEGANVRVATYSDKSFCVFGDTYPIRKMLKAAKLGYNPGLKCGPGWLGSNKRKEAILQLLGVQLETLTESELIAIGEQRKASSRKPNNNQLDRARIKSKLGRERHRELSRWVLTNY